MDTASHGDSRHIPEDIERRRVLFEQTWGEPSAPSIEQLLGEVAETERAGLLRELLYVEFEFTQRKTAEVLLEQYLSRFPEYESIVREVAEAVGQYTVFQRRNIAGYTLLDELGRGGMGTVYRAKSDLLNNFVAFKMVNQRMLDNPASLRRFTRELEMIGRLKHPNIVEAKHAGIAPDGSPFLVMELIEGITLTQWSRRNPPPVTTSFKEPKSTLAQGTDPEPEASEPNKSRQEKQSESHRIAKACTIIHDAALGLQAIHEAGLVHRDIKPGNIMLLPDGRVKILDLGLAKLREQMAANPREYETQTKQGHILGTPGYMAPEQMHSATDVDIRADIYSLGCTFFFLLYGRAPTEISSNELAGSLPKKLRTILDRMLAVDPTSRFQEPREIVTALDGFLGTARRVLRNTGLLATGIVVAAGVAALFFAFHFYRESRLPRPPAPDEHHASLAAPMRAGENDNGKKPSPADVRAAVALRYRGDSEQASAILRKLESDLRAEPFDGSNVLLAEVLSAQGDCLFFSGIASNTVPEKTLKRLAGWYEEALELAALSSSILQVELLCKLSLLDFLRKTESNPTDDARASKRLAEARRLFLEENKTGEKSDTLLLPLAEAIISSDPSDQSLRSFLEQFELSTDQEWTTRESLDLRLFALEYLIDRDEKSDRDRQLKDLRSLDAVLLAPYPDADSCLYLNRFYDLAIRVCDPTDYGQLVKYLWRLRPQGTAGARPSFPQGATLVLIYFSPWSESNGFALYYPGERRDAKRFPLPFNRHEIKEAIRKGESPALDAELVALVRRDIDSGVPIVLSWDDTACWPLRRDAFGNEDWPFEKTISLEEILGQMK